MSEGAVVSDAAVSAVRNAESELERAYWDVHCVSTSVGRCEVNLRGDTR